MKLPGYRQRWREALSIIERQNDYIDGLEAEVARLGGTLEGQNAHLNREAAQARARLGDLRKRLDLDRSRRVAERYTRRP